jgi:hypothetical protein
LVLGSGQYKKTKKKKIKYPLTKPVKGSPMTLNITLSIGQVETELTTDEHLSFDAIESILNRNVQALLVMFNSLSDDDRLYALGLDADEDDEAYEDTDE